jgi:hypothetical protein
MLTNLTIPKELRRKIDNELQSGERIRWVEQPIPLFFTANSIGNAFFGIPLVIVGIFSILSFASRYKLPDLREGLQPQQQLDLFGVLFGLLFGVIPFLLGVKILIREWQAARNRVYLVTDKKAISIQGGWSPTIRSYFPDQLKNLYRKERADGTGDVILDIRRWRDSDGYQRSEEIGFLGVRNPREVENMLRQLVENKS